jgi:hypothetical protein
VGAGFAEDLIQRGLTDGGGFDGLVCEFEHWVSPVVVWGGCGEYIYQDNRPNIVAFHQKNR